MFCHAVHDQFDLSYNELHNINIIGGDLTCAHNLFVHLFIYLYTVFI